MNGAQDLGGMMGFEPIAPEKDEPPFHADWERRVLACTLACGAMGLWNIDQSRAARESLHPAKYLASTYYEIWLAGLEKLLAERGLVGADEIAAGRALHAAKPVPRMLKAEAVDGVLARGSPYERPAKAPARFAVGDAVRAKVTNPPTHTRIPRYVRGRCGVITAVHGAFAFPDMNALGRGDDPQWLYAVRFSGTELWGPDGDPASSVQVDLFEPYLESPGESRP